MSEPYEVTCKYVDGVYQLKMDEYPEVTASAEEQEEAEERLREALALVIDEYEAADAEFEVYFKETEDFDF